jgi:hypothetical protein
LTIGVWATTRNYGLPGLLLLLIVNYTATDRTNIAKLLSTGVFIAAGDL